MRGPGFDAPSSLIEPVRASSVEIVQNCLYVSIAQLTALTAKFGAF
jgi:hypothetical protein